MFALAVAAVAFARLGVRVVFLVWNPNEVLAGAGSRAHGRQNL